MLKGLDVDVNVVGHAHQIKAAGIDAVGFYLHQGRVDKAMIEGLAAAEIKRFSIFERGSPTAVGYFMPSNRGTIDAQSAVWWAKHLGQPKGTQIFYAVDYDATYSDIVGPIFRYMENAQKVTKQNGYLASVYGSGAVCKALVDKGFAHAGMLANGRSWTGYDLFLPHAAIIQKLPKNIAGFDTDPDDIVDPSVLW